MRSPLGPEGKKMLHCCCEFLIVSTTHCRDREDRLKHLCTHKLCSDAISLATAAIIELLDASTDDARVGVLDIRTQNNQQALASVFLIIISFTALKQHTAKCHTILCISTSVLSIKLSFS